MFSKLSPKTKLLLSILSIVLILIGWWLLYDQKMTVLLGGKEFIMDVADSPREQVNGLSGRKTLGEYRGMIFIFDVQDKYGFWMKEMNFPLDIIWVSSDYKIVDIKKNFLPSWYPDIYYPKSPAIYVLEISSGKSDELNIKIGDSIKILKK